MNFLSSQIQKEPFLVSDSVIFHHLKGSEQALYRLSNGDVSNGDAVVSKSDYNRRPPMKTFAFVRYVKRLLDEDIKALSLWNQSIEEIIKPPNNHGIRLFPYVEDNELNAFYTSNNGGELHFNKFLQGNEWIYTCDDYDVVAHETSHANLDEYRPDFNDSSCMQTKALHESYADFTVMSSLLEIDEIREKFLQETKGNLLKTTFIPMIGENLQNGKALRNAVNDKTMLNVEEEEHDQSNVFTGAIYKILAKGFDLLRKHFPQFPQDQILQKVVKDSRHLLLAALLLVPYSDPYFSDIGYQMRKIAKENKDWNYLSEIIDPIFLERSIDIDLSHEDAIILSPSPQSKISSCCCRGQINLKKQTQKKPALPIKVPKLQSYLQQFQNTDEPSDNIYSKTYKSKTPKGFQPISFNADEPSKNYYPIPTRNDKPKTPNVYEPSDDFYSVPTRNYKPKASNTYEPLDDIYSKTYKSKTPKDFQPISFNTYEPSNNFYPLQTTNYKYPNNLQAVTMKGFKFQEREDENKKKSQKPWFEY